MKEYYALTNRNTEGITVPLKQLPFPLNKSHLVSVPLGMWLVYGIRKYVFMSLII